MPAYYMRGHFHCEFFLLFKAGIERENKVPHKHEGAGRITEKHLTQIPKPSKDKFPEVTMRRDRRFRNTVHNDGFSRGCRELNIHSVKRVQCHDVLNDIEKHALFFQTSAAGSHDPESSFKSEQDSHDDNTIMWNELLK